MCLSPTSANHIFYWHVLEIQPNSNNRVTGSCALGYSGDTVVQLAMYPRVNICGTPCYMLCKHLNFHLFILFSTVCTSLRLFILLCHIVQPETQGFVCFTISVACMYLPPPPPTPPFVILFIQILTSPMFCCHKRETWCVCLISVFSQRLLFIYLFWFSELSFWLQEGWSTQRWWWNIFYS